MGRSRLGGHENIDAGVLRYVRAGMIGRSKGFPADLPWMRFF